ncbi:hydantoinase B/oxoprolinase family protein [Roseomonas stagni]|uniref:Hydantoinase B/oxoprolinase family protein n=1 Tax=Falsiroseomonas algicola TaxID=2716930 RepID=A0A6M1LLB2_9PROT|nr:hydantoinase B/oxoprolinase family protein [Falsiroseomonas algicola]NGM21120.1 hydantoinase B/oxoprolinase family protein [Falsiroseomonas algicola]
MNETPDPVTLAVLENRFRAVVEEMGEALLRTATSQILNSSRDFSIALCDDQARLVAQADHIPVHVGAMPLAAKAVLDAFGGGIAPGECYLLNDPWHGGSHLPDLTIIQPVFEGTILRFLTVVRAHQSDIGGATHGGYNPAASEIWQEGIRIPPIRLGEGDALRDDLVRMLALNTRIPRDFTGDLMAMWGAARLGAKRMDALLASHGGARLAAAVDAILDLSEAHARRIIEGWADGDYEGQAVLDDDGHGVEDITIRARVTKCGGQVSVDLSGSDDQVRGFVNSSWPNTLSAARMALAYLLDPEVAKNDGAFRALDLVAREGSVVNARPGAAVTLCTSHCSNEIVEAIVKALAPACPDRAMGGWGRRFRVAIQGTDPRRAGRRFVWHLFHARPGGGGHAKGDGWSSVGEWHSAGGLKFGSVEMAEARFPLFFAHHELRPGSGGEGQFRGGLGAELDLRIETAGAARANTAGDGVRHGAAGMLGGEDGAPHHYTLRHADGTERDLKTKEAGVVLNPGDRLIARSGGGGGWGDKAARDPAAIEADKAEGYLPR